MSSGMVMAVTNGSWTITTNWREAHFFDSGSEAGHTIWGVDRIRSRLARGWVYEVVKVTEEVLSSNLKPEEVQ